MQKIGTHTFQKVLYQMASKCHVPKLDRGGSCFPRGRIYQIPYINTFKNQKKKL